MSRRDDFLDEIEARIVRATRAAVVEESLSARWLETTRAPMPHDRRAECFALAGKFAGHPSAPNLRAEHFGDPVHAAMWMAPDAKAAIDAVVALGRSETWALDYVSTVCDAASFPGEALHAGARVRRLAARRQAMAILRGLEVALSDASELPAGIESIAKECRALVPLADVIAGEK